MTINRSVARELLLDEKVFAVSMYFIMREVLDYNFLDIDEHPPEATLINLEKEFEINIPESNEHKINALITALGTDGFYEDVNIFKAVCNSFFEDFDLDYLDDNIFTDEVFIEEIAWAMVELGFMRDHIDFSDSVVDLINKIVQKADVETYNSTYQKTISSLQEMMEAEIQKLTTP